MRRCRRRPTAVVDVDHDPAAISQPGQQLAQSRESFAPQLMLIQNLGRTLGRARDGFHLAQNREHLSEGGGFARRQFAGLVARQRDM